MSAAAGMPLTASYTGIAFRRPPRGMSRAPADPEMVRAVQRIALDVFTDMSNAGYSLRETLAAIYLTGAENAIAATVERGE